MMGNTSCGGNSATFWRGRGKGGGPNEKSVSKINVLQTSPLKNINFV